MNTTTKNFKFTDYSIRVWEGTVFINSPDVNMVYTPSKNNDMWVGGLQCNYIAGSDEYQLLEKKLIEISKAFLLLHDGVLQDQ